LGHAAPGFGAHRAGELQVLLNDVLTFGDVDPVRIQPARRRLPERAAIEPDDATGARHPGEERRLDQPLEIGGDVVAFGAERPPHLEPGRRRPIPEHDGARDDGDEREKRLVHAIHQPVDPRIGKRATQRAHGRQRVHEIAERPEPHDQNPLQGPRLRAPGPRSPH
jgi:hypothetical protein